jgi:DUF4097 and DUF4098 domain-containing protein YvlB
MLIRFIAASMASLLVAISTYAQTHYDERRPLSASRFVRISNTIGSVSVTGQVEAEASDVRVVGELESRVKRVDFTTTEKETFIEVVIPKEGRDRGADLEITLPAGCSLEIDCVSASITVTNVSGKLNVRSVSGNIEIKGAPSKTRARTVSGTIDVEVTGAEMDVSSVSGNVIAHGAKGNCNVETISGKVEVSGSAIEYLAIETVSGNVEIECSVAPKIRANLHSISGKISLKLLGEVSAEFYAQTLSGDIDNDFGHQTLKKNKFGLGTELEFTAGDGAGQINADTLSGDIAFLKK